MCIKVYVFQHMWLSLNPMPDLADEVTLFLIKTIRISLKLGKMRIKPQLHAATQQLESRGCPELKKKKKKLGTHQLPDMPTHAWLHNNSELHFLKYWLWQGFLPHQACWQEANSYFDVIFTCKKTNQTIWQLKAAFWNFCLRLMREHSSSFKF